MGRYSLYIDDLVRSQDPAQSAVRAAAPTVACATAQNAYGQASLFNGLFTALVFGVCAVIAIAVSLIILGAIDVTRATNNDQVQLMKGAIEAGIGVIGTAASSVALKFVVDRRGEIKQEQTAALGLVREYCGDQVADEVKI